MGEMRAMLFAQMDALADLSAGPHQGVGVNHGPVVYVGTRIDEHGRHAGHAATDVRAIAELSDGTLLMAKREVKVTVGGCGG